MKTYYFTLEGIAERLVSVEANNAQEAFEFIDSMVRRTNVADFTEDEITHLKVTLDSGEYVNGCQIPYEIMEKELDKTDGRIICYPCNEED